MSSPGGTGLDTLSETVIDRRRPLPFDISHRPFTPGVKPPDDRSEPAWWFAFAGKQLLVCTEGEALNIPAIAHLAEIGLKPLRSQYLGRLNGRHCYSAELPSQAIAPTGTCFKGFRDLYGAINDDLFAIGGRAIQIVEWDRTHQYCGYCATPTTQQPHERAKRCPNCQLVNYPRLSPAIIVLVSRGEHLLLARAPRFRPGMYSVLAGFVEPGESLEETIRREVREEVGIEIEQVEYFGSQPWPFPNSLMIGFTARYARGSISIDPHEIEDARWFHKSDLPPVPSTLSIARKLIDSFVSGGR